MKEEILKNFLIKEEMAKSSDTITIHQVFESFVIFTINNYSTRYTADFTKSGKFKTHSVRLDR